MSHKLFRSLFVLIFVIGLVAIQAPQPARAAGPWYVSTTGDDSNDCLSPTTPCATINGAIGKAASGDTVNVATGTYTSTGSEVVLIDKDITLLGGWDTTFTTQSGMSTVNGEATRRGMQVAPYTDSTIEYFVIQNGSAGLDLGGGIYNAGTLILNNSQVIENYASNAAGIANYDGSLTINNSIINYNFTDYGVAGGIYNNGSLTLNNSSVSHNSATGVYSEGGGIFNYRGGSIGSLTLNNSTVSNNFATNYGGIYTFNGTLNLNNSTISGNLTNGYGGGIYNYISTLNLNNVTITDNVADADNDMTGNGGGIYNINIGFSGVINIRNSILAGNVDNSSNAPDCWGELTSQGYTMIQNTTGCTISGSPIGNLIGIDPLLGILQNNGGPTLTHELLFDSPAIDAGNPTGCTDQVGNPLTTDQRGVARPQGARCDIGAFELEVAVVDQVLDDFNRADGPIGDYWSRYTSQYRISNNQLRVRSSGSNTDIYWHAAFGPDQEAFFTFAQINETALEQILLLKSQSNQTWGDGVIEVLYDAPDHNVQVWTWEWPKGWVKYGDDIPVTFMVNDTFGARAKPDGTVEVYRNGVLLATRDITTWSHHAKGGYIGLWFIGARNTIIDDFGGGTVPNSAEP